MLVAVPASQQTELCSAATLCCSLNEAGLWDYVIVNDTMEKTGQQLQAIAERALAGQIGNGIAPVPTADPSSVVSISAQKPSCCITRQHMCMPAMECSILDKNFEFATKLDWPLSLMAALPSLISPTASNNSISI